MRVLRCSTSGKRFVEWRRCTISFSSDRAVADRSRLHEPAGGKSIAIRDTGRRRGTPTVGSAPIILIGLITTALLTTALVTAPGYDGFAAVVVGTALIALSLPILAREARREADPKLFWMLAAALMLKLLASLLYIYVFSHLYNADNPDATQYQQLGAALSRHYRAGEFHSKYHLSGTQFIIVLTAIVNAVIGRTTMGVSLVFSWLSFWGLFFFYRAFVIAVPGGRRRTYGRLVFFLPTLLFWPSAIGKDAWMVFTLGLAALGAARLLSGRTWRGLVTMGVGLWLAALVRPHVAALLAVGLAFAYLIRRPKGELRQLGPVVKVVFGIVMSVAAFALVRQSEAFLKDQGIDTQGSVTSQLGQVSSTTYGGHSAFVPSIVESPTRAPVAIVTVLFRPLPFEAHNVQSLLSALESTFLILLAITRIRWILAAVGRVRRYPYIGLAIAYTLLFVVAYSSIANFGILVRQRSALLPLLLVLVAIPPEQEEQETSEAVDG